LESGDGGKVEVCFLRGGGHRGGRGIFGDFFDHVAVGGEAGAAGVFYGDMEGAEDEFGTLQIDGVAQESVDDFHEGGLDGLLVLDEGDGMEAGLRGSFDAAEHALVEVAELLSAERRGAATDSGDFDVGAAFDIGMNWHIGPIDDFLVVSG
jgi:hypothetical protein